MLGRLKRPRHEKTSDSFHTVSATTSIAGDNTGTLNVSNNQIGWRNAGDTLPQIEKLCGI